jgi:hypothetical protein
MTRFESIKEARQKEPGKTTVYAYRDTYGGGTCTVFVWETGEFVNYFNDENLGRRILERVAVDYMEEVGVVNPKIVWGEVHSFENGQFFITDGVELERDGQIVLGSDDPNKMVPYREMGQTHRGESDNIVEH